MARGRLLHAREGPAGDASLAPGIGGSATVAATASVDDGGLQLDPTATRDLNPPTPLFNTPSSTSTPPLLDSLTSSPDATPTAVPSSSSSDSGHRTTIIIAAVAGAALALIALFSLLLFCRSGHKKEKRKRRGSSDPGTDQHNWREIESQQTHPEYKGMGAVAAMSEYKGGRETYHSRQSSVAPPSLHLEFEPEPLMHNNNRNPFDSPSSPIPPIPQMPPPPSAASYSHPPSEYSYYRSMYSDSQSVHSSRKSFTLKRSASAKSRNHKELIALDKLISALDLSANDEKERMRQLEPGNHNSQRDSYIPKDFPLPPPAVFRAALGAGDD
ncbi:hypothetical protein EXIGLDRAFT_720214 [Exidia glandulosa HHB12029]|uniref:Uncharacterized protein n=1 Tax=Exidia glandulosa HHB12029 TaxID=1314781 RepID=A0A165GJG1_EXIGL|nr:hypothetical protein EXIGLDRAFT_720214 [Exidia glandulosa HHB12029]